MWIKTQEGVLCNLEYVVKVNVRNGEDGKKEVVAVLSNQVSAGINLWGQNPGKPAPARSETIVLGKYEDASAILQQIEIALEKEPGVIKA